MLPVSSKRFFTLVSRRFALLVVLGLCIVATPLAEVWRRHGVALQFAVEARRGLEAVTLAVHAQRALIAHRPYAAAVLSGRAGQEGERLRRQQAVDAEVAALAAALEVRRLHRALEEADHLRDDWSTLLQGLGRRQMQAAASDAAHDLLIEQTFVIADLVAAESGLLGQAGRPFDAEALALALRTLPRLSAVLAARPDEATGLSHEAEQRQRLLAHGIARAARALLAAADAGAAADAAKSAPDPLLVSALVSALVTLEHHTTALAQAPSPSAAQAQRAMAASVGASDALIARADADLMLSMAALRLERGIVAAAGALALLIVMLAAVRVLPRGRSSSEGAATRVGDGVTGTSPVALDTASVSVGAESQGPTSDLLQRLRRRESDADADADPAGAARGD